MKKSESSWKDKTIKNWRWWVVLPIILTYAVPFVTAGLIFDMLYMAGKYGSDKLEGFPTPKIFTMSVRWAIGGVDGSKE